MRHSCTLHSNSIAAQTCQVCGKIFVGSDMGNVGQILRETGKYSFDPKYAGSVVDAFQQALTDIPKGKEKKNRHQALGFWTLKQQKC